LGLDQSSGYIFGPSEREAVGASPRFETPSWCVLCGIDGFGDYGDRNRCPDPRRSERHSGHRWAHSQEEALQTATEATPNPHEPFHYFESRGAGGINRSVVSPKPEVVKGAAPDAVRRWQQEAVDAMGSFGNWCAYCGEGGPTKGTHCRPGLRHQMVDTADEARGFARIMNVPAWLEPRRELSGRWCMLCAASEGGAATPGLCGDARANSYDGHHVFVASSEEAEELRRAALGQPTRPGPSGRAAAWARAEALAAEARRIRHGAPSVHRSLVEDLARVFADGGEREKPPPVGMAESILRAVQAIDSEQWQDADDALTAAMVHFRAAAVLLEEASPPAEALRMRAKVARAAFAADFVADELSSVREMVRREAAKGRAS